MTPTSQSLLDLLRDFLGRYDRGLAQPFIAAVAGAMDGRNLGANPLPCLRHLPLAAGIASESARPLARHLATHGASLHWGQTYTAADFGQAFIKNYGWLEVCGARGHFINADVAAGFLLLGPNQHYPDHHHVAEEIYIPLTGGTEWRMGDAAFARRDAGDLIHHPSDVSHAMRTGEAPLLAVYLWRGGPLAQRSVIGVQKGREASRG